MLRWEGKRLYFGEGELDWIDLQNQIKEAVIFGDNIYVILDEEFAIFKKYKDREKCELKYSTSLLTLLIEHTGEVMENGIEKPIEVMQNVHFVDGKLRRIE